MADSLILQLTGRFAALVAGGREIGGLPIRRRAILAYLARRPGHAAPRAELAALLWGDRADPGLTMKKLLASEPPSASKFDLQYHSGLRDVGIPEE